MRIIALASQKGGSGKTATVGHLAMQARRVEGKPTALTLKADPAPMRR